MTVRNSVECCAEALALEQLATIVSYKPDRDRCLRDARYWRGQEQAALLREAKEA